MVPITLTPRLVSLLLWTEKLKEIKTGKKCDIQLFYRRKKKRLLDKFVSLLNKPFVDLIFSEQMEKGKLSKKKETLNDFFLIFENSCIFPISKFFFCCKKIQFSKLLNSTRLPKSLKFVTNSKFIRNYFFSVFGVSELFSDLISDFFSPFSIFPNFSRVLNSKFSKIFILNMSR